MLVCAFPCASCTRDRGCSAHPAFPAPSSREGRRNETSGKSCREKAKLCLEMATQAPHTRCHAPRRRGIQYSRDAGAGNEKRRRTGYPAFAGYDGLLFCWRAEALAKAAKPGDDERRAGSLKVKSVPTTSLRGAVATKQSILSLVRHGLL